MRTLVLHAYGFPSENLSHRVCGKIHEMEDSSGASRRGEARRWLAIPFLIVGASVGIVYLPALRLELLGDAYQLIHHAHAATRYPSLLFADVDGFLRPAATWSLVVDRLIWRSWSSGFHLTNLVFFSVASGLLAVVARRLGLGRLASVLIAALWALSQFTDELAILTAGRIETLLACAWFSLIIVWPRNEEQWNPKRVVIATLVTFAAMASKETWVVTPGLVVLLEVGQRQKDLGCALRTAVPFLAAAAVYVFLYFVVFDLGGRDYFHYAVAPLAKIPHQLAAFLHLEELTPILIPFSWRGAVALAAIVALAISCWQNRLRAALPAFGIFFLPMLPTLLVPYLPQRFTAIPYAGFLLALSIWVTHKVRVHPWRRMFQVGVAILVPIVLIAGSLTVRADIDDYFEVSKAHRKLLTEAEEIAYVFEPGVPVAVVRLERDQPLFDALRSPRGVVKLPYTRHPDPYGLIDTGALFDWVLTCDGMLVRQISEDPLDWSGIPGKVILHLSGGFELYTSGTADLGGDIALWKQRGYHVRVIVSEVS